MSFVAAWIELKGIMLAEISHKEKEKYRMVSLICGIQGKQARDKEKLNKL